MRCEEGDGFGYRPSSQWVEKQGVAMITTITIITTTTTTTTTTRGVWEEVV